MSGGKHVPDDGPQGALRVYGQRGVNAPTNEIGARASIYALHSASGAVFAYGGVYFANGCCPYYRGTNCVLRC
jgi:hypothetical protein